MLIKIEIVEELDNLVDSTEKVEFVQPKSVINDAVLLDTIMEKIDKAII